MNGLISVIVPVHNAERFLSDCLGSLTDQTYRKLEILVIDDGSTDGSAALCRRWQEKDGRIRFFQKDFLFVKQSGNLYFGIVHRLSELRTLLGGDVFHPLQ